MTTEFNIPFARVPLGGNEMQYMQEVLASGWLTTSSKTFLFESLFAEYVGAKYACAVNSCTAALHLAVEAAGIGPGDKVLVPTMTFTASAEILRYVGAHPVFIDVDYGTRLITPDILEQALKRHLDIKALILVHFGGQAAVMTTPEENGILDICRKHKIVLIEDAAHAFPTRSGDKYVGSFGDVTCFSFYANKTITTGEGGMLTTNNEMIYRRAKLMRLHGINHDIWDRFTDQRCKWEYDIVAPGFKYNMPDVNAAIGLAQLEKAEYFREQRQRCAEFYYRWLIHLSTIHLPECKVPMKDHSWHLFPVVIAPEAIVSRYDFINLMAEKGIGTSVHYKPLHRMSYFKKAYNIQPESYPNSEKIWEGTVSLPIYPDLKENELEYICDSIESVLKQKTMEKYISMEKKKAI